MNSIMSEIRLITQELFVLEILEIAVLNLLSKDRNLISQSIWAKVAKSIFKHETADELDHERLVTLSYWPGKIEDCCLPCQYDRIQISQLSGPKLHKVFLGTRSRMSSKMSEICQVTRKLFALEWLKIVVLNLGSLIETWFLNQSGPKLHKVFISTSSRMSSTTSEIHSVTRKCLPLNDGKLCFQPCMLRWAKAQMNYYTSIWLNISQIRHKGGFFFFCWSVSMWILFIVM